MLNRSTRSNGYYGRWRNPASMRSHVGVAYRSAGDGRGWIDTWLDRKSVHRAMSVFVSCAIILGWSLQDDQYGRRSQKNSPPAATPAPAPPSLLDPPVGSAQPHLAMNALTDNAQKLLYVNLWGRIDDADGRRFRALVTPYLQSSYVLYRVTISSPGGSVEAAMDIGNQIRTLRGQVRAPVRAADGKPHCVFGQAIRDTVHASGDGLADPDGFACLCASACSFVWSSGFVREGDVIGVHMFRFTPDTLVRWSPAELHRQTEFRKAEMDGYLARMGMPAGVRARVWSTPADDLYDLSPWEVDAMSRNVAFLPVLEARCAGDSNALSAPREPAIQTNDPSRSLCYRKTLMTMMRLGAARYLGRLDS
jgi:hypothetical protein